MNAKGLIDVFSGLVTVALVTTIVAHQQSASVITSLGNAFSGSIKAATGAS